MRFDRMLVLALLACGFAFAQIEGQETRSLEIDDTVVEYRFVVPEGFTPEQSYPALVVFPPWGAWAGTESSANRVLDDWFRDGARARGWVVVSPLAPLDPVLRVRVPYHLGSETLIPPLLEHLAGQVSFEGDHVHLAGVYSGGMGAFRVATLYPDWFESLLVISGRAEDVDLERVAVLAGTPVRIYVGEHDVEYGEAIRATSEALEEAGVACDLVVVEGEGMRTQSLTGAELFDWLDAQRP